MDADIRLETQRLVLRPYREEDLEDLHAMFSDPEHMRWYPAPFDRDGTQAWMERTFERYRDDGFGLWIVEDGATGAFLGTVGPTIQLVDDVGHVEIGWHVRPGRKGDGIAPEAAWAARDWAFENLDVDHAAGPARNMGVWGRPKLGMHVAVRMSARGCATSGPGSIVLPVSRVTGRNTDQPSPPRWSRRARGL